jgi:hypothetical protein
VIILFLAALIAGGQSDEPESSETMGSVPFVICSDRGDHNTELPAAVHASEVKLISKLLKVHNLHPKIDFPGSPDTMFDFNPKEAWRAIRVIRNNCRGMKGTRICENDWHQDFRVTPGVRRVWNEFLHCQALGFEGRVRDELVLFLKIAKLPEEDVRDGGTKFLRMAARTDRFSHSQTLFLFSHLYFNIAPYGPQSGDPFPFAFGKGTVAMYGASFATIFYHEDEFSDTYDNCMISCGRRNLTGLKPVEYVHHTQSPTGT